MWQIRASASQLVLHGLRASWLYLGCFAGAVAAGAVYRVRVVPIVERFKPRPKTKRAWLGGNVNPVGVLGRFALSNRDSFGGSL